MSRNNTNKCMICFEPLFDAKGNPSRSDYNEEGAEPDLRQLGCKHMFHNSCLGKLVVQECPICRAPITEKTRIYAQANTRSVARLPPMPERLLSAFKSRAGMFDTVDEFLEYVRASSMSKAYHIDETQLRSVYKNATNMAGGAKTRRRRQVYKKRRYTRRKTGR